MRKKALILIISIILMLQPLYTAVATDSNEDIESVSTYYLGDTVYSFLQQNTLESSPIEEARLRLKDSADESFIESNNGVKRLVDTDSGVRYMLLIDASTSMEWYSSSIKEFATALFENEQQECVIDIATFGAEFELVEGNIDDSAELSEVIDSIEYDESATLIYEGLEAAYDFLLTQELQSGQLMNLLLVTDGIPYSDDGLDGLSLEEKADDISKLISSTVEVILHTVEVSTWNEVISDAVSVSTGLNLSLSYYNATDLAVELAEFIDNLYRLDFVIPDKEISDDISAELWLFLYSGGNKVVNITELVNLNKRYNITAPVTQPKTEPDNTDAIQKDTTTAATEETATTGSIITPEPEKPDLTCLLLIILVVLAVIVVVLIVLLLIKRNKTIPSTSDGIVVHLQVLSGELIKGAKNIKLTDKMIIGSAKHCDIIFADSTVYPENTRIFLQDNLIYIEDMKEKSNTYLGGMKIHSANRLRSGDEISIGDVRFTLRF